MLIPTKFNGFTEGRRVYCKGGDGGAKAMRRMEEERQERINAAIKAINEIFDPPSHTQGTGQATSYDPSKTYYNADGSVFDPMGTFSETYRYRKKGGAKYLENDRVTRTRQVRRLDMDKVNRAIANGQLYSGVETVQPENRRLKLYEDQRDAVYQINSKDVNRQYGDAERNNRFGLARHGLMGGSADVDSNAQLQEITNEGLMRASGIADSAAANLKAKDESARQNLIAMAQSGIDTGTAQQMAMEKLDTTAQEAEGARAGASVGDLFGNLTQAYLRYKKLNGEENALSLNGNNQSGLSTRTSYNGYTSR